MKTEDIIIVGGGPVGLFMGLCLLHRNIPCTIIEQRTKLVSDSRSIGIHPVSMELFEQLGIADEFLKNGIKVSKGIAHDGKNKIGEVDFESILSPFNFILINPQFETERILRERFVKLAPGSLITGAEVIGVKEDSDFVTLTVQKDGKEHSVEADYLICCDGKNSFVREAVGIKFQGKQYPDTYIMGDFKDSTEFGLNATIYLTNAGLIECFPLPNNNRRWVVKTEKFVDKPSVEMISKIVLDQTGHQIDASTNTMISGFGVQHYIADQFVKNRVLLAGDAAHVVSPIGGQGMNLGWIGAWKLSQALASIQEQPTKVKYYLSKYQKDQQLIAKKVAIRAEWNMRLGRKSEIPFFKKILVTILLNTPLRKMAAERFAMRNLTEV